MHPTYCLIGLSEDEKLEVERIAQHFRHDRAVATLSDAFGLGAGIPELDGELLHLDDVVRLWAGDDRRAQWAMDHLHLNASDARRPTA